MARIQFDGVTKVFPDGTEAVSSLDLAIPEGCLMVFVGPSGCGKTTALRMVAGLEDITGGTIAIGDRVVNHVAPKDRDIAMVFQNYALYPHMTVYQNMALSLKVRKVAKEEIDRRVRDAAAILDLDQYLARKPRALSGGQRQRVAMGRAIVREPQAFLMDEPLSNLDAKLRVQMRGEIQRLQRDLAVTTIYVTHDQTEAMTLGDQVCVMRRGVLQQVDAPQVLYRRPANLFVAGFIGSPAMNMVEARLENAGPDLDVVFGSHRLRVPDEVRSARPALAEFEGRPVIVGIRPEDMDDAERAGTGPQGSMLHVGVDLREEMGSDVYVHFVIDAPPAITEDTKDLASDRGDEALETLKHEADTRQTTFVARADPMTAAQVGGRFAVTVNTRNLHFFDPASGSGIYGDPGRARAGMAGAGARAAGITPSGR